MTTTTTPTLHDPASRVLFPIFPPEVVDELRAHGTVEDLDPGGLLFSEGQPEYDFFVILEGEVRITKRLGAQERLLAVHRPGEFAGEISILSRGAALATARAVGRAKVLRVPAAEFRRMVAERTPLAETALAAMVGRTRDVDAQLRQQEKLTALGRMAAGLAHELNNPAAAAARAAGSLRDAALAAQRRCLEYDRRLTPAQRAAVEALYREIAEEGGDTPALGALDRSDAEDEVAAWLGAHGVDDPWQTAAALVASGATGSCMRALEGVLEGDALEAAVEWIGTALQLAGLGRELESSTGRISALVGAMREYSYMDRAPIQRLDVHDGLETTLVILNHKLRQGVAVVRDYDRALPRVCVSGSELNQVWTNLIDNAVHAMGGRGTLRLTTRRADAGRVCVEVGDDGPGIAPEILPLIWEPFFTTRGVGEGTGLGLDIARRIVEQGHAGEIRVRSRPGDTRFTVYLPIDGPPQGERGETITTDDDDSNGSEAP